MTTRIYDSNEVAASFAGIPFDEPIQGEFITITWTSDAFTSSVGSRGEVARAKTNDYRATIEVRLMQTSPTNTALSLIHQADLNAPGGAGIGGFFLTDLNGTTVIVAGNAWIRRAPDAAYANEPGERVWTFECDNLRSFVGGNI